MTLPSNLLHAGSRGLARLAFVLLAACLLVAPVAAAEPTLRHEPLQPKPGEPVRITAEFPAGPAPAGAILEYQVVAPGQYLAKDDPRFARQWTAVPMATSTAGVFSVELPGSLNQNRGLVRYRVLAARDRRRLLPPPGDEQGNLAYFVHAGVPEWRGAVNPKGESSAVRKLMTFSPAVLTRVPVYYWLAAREAVENVLWKETTDFGDEEKRHAYKYTGTLVYDGVVYDHVKFRARGGSWRHAMGKNMWKFNFNPGHRFAARDAYGQPYRGRWDKLNLGACIQQGDYGMRGEQGMLEAVTYRLFNLAGVEAPRTHWVHLRVITEPEETPADQYRGDFWGLYLATEEVDGDFLKEHGLPDGNAYKIDLGEPKTEHLAKGAPADQADVKQFLSTVMRGGGRRPNPGAVATLDRWWEETVDLPRYYSYRAMLECVHHYDLDSGKNYFFYNNLTAGRWQVIPWDVDLTWGDHMYGGGWEPFYRTGLLERPPFREAYQARLAELLDLLFNPDETGRLIDEYAAMIWDPKGGPSLADADRAKWDYHPIMSSGFVDPSKTRPGLFYLGGAGHRFEVMPPVMKQYVTHRRAHLARLLTGYNPPPAPEVSVPGTPDFAARSIPVRARMPEVTGIKFQWRLAEVSDPGSAGFDPRQPWHYEIEPLWTSEVLAAPQADVPTKLLAPGRLYRLRVRAQDPDGRWSRWSEPVRWAVK